MRIVILFLRKYFKGNKINKEKIYNNKCSTNLLYNKNERFKGEKWYLCFKLLILL